MELIGIKRTPKGGKYYLAKNSWGEDNALGGYMYLSENYLRMKTIAVWMTHEAYEQKNTSKQP
jgi:bleomycin hydrolase